eukprot:5818920-Amphidinium_carterae.1
MGESSQEPPGSNHWLSLARAEVHAPQIQDCGCNGNPESNANFPLVERLGYQADHQHKAEEKWKRNARETR